MIDRKRGISEISSSNSTIAIKVPSNSDNKNDEHDDYVRITPLGAGNEVGRSCILITYVHFFIYLF